MKLRKVELYIFGVKIEWRNSAAVTLVVPPRLLAIQSVTSTSIVASDLFGSSNPGVSTKAISTPSNISIAASDVELGAHISTAQRRENKKHVRLWMGVMGF